jgi:hypothetical protein
MCISLTTAAVRPARVARLFLSNYFIHTVPAAA